MGEVGVRKLLLFAMAERWYSLEDEPETVLSDLENRLFVMCRWVKCQFPGSRKLYFEKQLEAVEWPMEPVDATHHKPPLPELKSLIRDLSRCIVRRCTELDLDIPIASRPCRIHPRAVNDNSSRRCAGRCCGDRVEAGDGSRPAADGQREWERIWQSHIFLFYNTL